MGVPLFLNGEGMRGGSLHHTVSEHAFLGEVRTAARYRFYSVGDRFPAVWHVDDGGVSVLGELYDVPLEVIRDVFVPAEPPELELGVVELADSSAALAVVLRAAVHADGAGLVDISDLASWRAYRERA